MTYTLILAVLIALLAYVRFAPSDPQVWHEPEPATAARPVEGSFLVRPEGGDVVGPVLAMSPAEVLAKLDKIAMATPRTKRLSGSPEEGRITYVTRSLVIAFPDYTTVAVVEAEGGSQPVIFARLRFGRKDFGVNEKRVRAWLAQLTS